MFVTSTFLYASIPFCFAAPKNAKVAWTASITYEEVQSNAPFTSGFILGSFSKTCCAFKIFISLFNTSFFNPFFHKAYEYDSFLHH